MKGSGICLKAKKITADCENSHVECLRLNRISICAENGCAHFLYDCDEYLDFLSQCGLQIKTSTLDLPVPAAFNDLKFTQYELEQDICDIFIFKSLAIKVGQNGLEIYIKRKMNISLAAKHWGILRKISDTDIVTQYGIPNDKTADLAIQLEKLSYQVCNLIRGEIPSNQERLDTVEEYYGCLQDGDNFKGYFIKAHQQLNRYITENLHLSQSAGEDRPYYANKIDRAKKIITELRVLQMEIDRENR